MPIRPARLSRSAQLWLKREIEYLSKRSPAAAKELANRIVEARKLLTEHPRSAPSGQIPGTRRLVVAPYILTIRERGGAVEIAAIRHSKQADAYAPKDLIDDNSSA